MKMYSSRQISSMPL